jgi:hypothetical protein
LGKTDWCGQHPFRGVDLKDVKNHIGDAKESSRKVEECCIERSICYVSGKRDLAFHFSAFAGNSVTSFEVTSDKQRISALKQCSIVPALKEPHTNTLGIRLGLEKAQLINTLGKDGIVNYASSDEIGYEHACIRTDLKPEGWRRYTSIRVRFDNQGRVIGYSLSQTTQN